MTTDPTRCADCGAIIAPGGQPPHEATPRTPAAGVWQGAQVRLREAEAGLEALRPLVAAARSLEGTWDRLCRCVDEFGPKSDACGEYRDALDQAILGVIRAAAVDGEETP